MFRSLSNNPIAPVLSPKHFTSLERRLEVVLRVVDACIVDNNVKTVSTTSWKRIATSQVLIARYDNPSLPIDVQLSVNNNSACLVPAIS